MKLVISPAKTLDYESKLPVKQNTEALFLSQAERLNKILKKKSARSLSKLMSISDDLGQLNFERNQNWELPFEKGEARPAIYAFNGDVYRGIDAYTIKETKIEQLQNTVRILSGLYGILKPLDLILPYRLEMGTKLTIGKQKNLYQFWKKKVTTALNNEIDEDELFLNLASTEYFKAIDVKSLKTPVIDVDFKEFKDGNYKTIGFFAKYARGLMVRYIIDTNASTLEDIKGFNYERYRLSEELSSDKKLVFTR